MCIKRLLAYLSIAAAASVHLSFGALAIERPLEVKVALMEGSEPGWLPTPADFEQALAALDEFTSKIEDGNYRRAYDMLTPVSRGAIPIKGFVQLHDSRRKELGPVKQRRILQVTWGRNPPAAPASGIYVAIDVVAEFKKAKRYCGYVILYQGRPGERYTIMREESAFITDSLASTIERQSKTALDQTWSQMASTCPNYSPATAGTIQP